MQENTEREERLQADSEWLFRLSNTISNVTYSRMIHYMSTATYPLEVIPPGVDPEQWTEALREFAGFGQNSILSRLVKSAIQTLDARVHGPMPVDLMFLYTAIPTLNGLCLKTPNEGVAIVLNHGLVPYIALTTHLILGLTSWTDGQYCTHYSNDEMLRSLFELAIGIHDEKPALLVKAPATECLGDPSRPHPTNLHEAMCIIAEYFIIYHELGHVMLHHLDVDDVALGFRPEIDVTAPVFNRSQENELAADRFAYRHLVNVHAKDGGLADRDVAYGVGCMFALLRTVEVLTPAWASETHPSAAIRWRQIRTHLDEVIKSGALNSIDYFFDWIDDHIKAEP